MVVEEEDGNAGTSRAVKRFEPDAADFQDQDDDAEVAPKSMVASGATGTAWVMPDARLLNRLFTWLIASGAAKEDTQAQDLRGGGVEEGAGEMGDDEMLLPSNPFIVERAKSLYEDDYYPYAILVDILDIECVNLVYKSSVQGLRRCEKLLQLPRTSLSSLVSEDAAMDVVDGRVEPPATAFDQKNSNPGDTTKPPLFTAEDSTRLASAFVLFGAPLSPAKSANVPGCVSALYASVSDMDEASLHSNLRTFSWEDIIRVSGLEQPVELVINFYDSIWLPFCNSISSKKQLSHSQNKLVLPNPLRPLSDHSFASRGLCHIFYLRQQIRMSTHFILENSFSKLLDYLRSPFGRCVQYMPVWWCPWVHDLGLLLVVVKYGYLNQLSVPEIMEDAQLPFFKPHLEQHVRSVFLKDMDKDGGDAFLQAALAQFPDCRELEVRVMRILEDMMKLLGLPHESPVRFCSFSLLQGPSLLTLEGLSAQPQTSLQSPQQGMGSTANSVCSGEGVDTAGKSSHSGQRVLDFGLKHAVPTSMLPRKISEESLRESPCLRQDAPRCPPVPIKQYLEETRAKRRRFAIGVTGC